MRITRASLDLLKPQLSDRDLAIIHEVGRFKLMRADQLERLFFTEYEVDGQRRAYSPVSRARNRQAVLKRLVDQEILATVGERQQGGVRRGSSGFLYRLDKTGQYLAEQTSSQPRRPLTTYKPHWDHYLAIAEVYVALVEAQRAGMFRRLRFDVEPYCWRSFRDQRVKPDGFVQVDVDRGERTIRGSFFLEVDRAQEWGKQIPTKLDGYISYRVHEQSLGRATPRILLLAPTDTRVAYLAAEVAKKAAGYQALFGVDLLERVAAAVLPA